MTYSSSNSGSPNSYFRQVPNLDYPSLANDRTSAYDFQIVKNLFKRAVIRDDIFDEVTAFEKYSVDELEKVHDIPYKNYNNRQSSGTGSNTIVVDRMRMRRQDAINLANKMNTKGSITFSQTDPPLRYENIGNGRVRISTRTEGSKGKFVELQVVTTEEAIAQRGLDVLGIEVEKPTRDEYVTKLGLLDIISKNLKKQGENSVLKKEEE